jgi:hypothetical protein
MDLATKDLNQNSKLKPSIIPLTTTRFEFDGPTIFFIEPF